jgi:hypothetical protein
VSITWAEPGPKRQGPRIYDEFWAALKNHPGCWAIYPGASSSVIISRRSDGPWETAGRVVEGKKVSYVRWMGAEQ